MVTEKQILERIDALEKRVAKANEELKSAEWDLAFERRNLGGVRMAAIRKSREEKP